MIDKTNPDENKKDDEDTGVTLKTCKYGRGIQTGGRPKKKSEGVDPEVRRCRITGSRWEKTVKSEWGS